MTGDARRRWVALVPAAAGALAIAALVWHHMAILGDGFCSIAVGRWILAHHALPLVDPFAYASAGEGYMIDSAGRCALFALVAKAVGLRGLMVFGVAVEALAVGLLWLRSGRTLAARLATFPLAVFFIQVDAEDLSARGQLFGDLGFVLLLGLLARLRDGRRVSPALIVLLAALWTNLHLSFLIVFLLPLIAAVLLLLDAPADRPPLRPFVVAGVLALVATAITPYGARYFPFAARFALDAGHNQLDLHRSPPFHEPVWLVAPLLGLAMIVARGRVGPARARRAEQAMLLMFVAMACTARRYATELVAVEIALLGPMLDEQVARSRWRAVADRAGVLLGAGALFVALAVQWGAVSHDPLGDSPVGAARVAREAERELRAAKRKFTRVVDPLHWGGYLAYAWDGDPRYFIDGRDHLVLFGNGAFTDSSALWAGAPDWPELLDAYEAGAVLWERGAPLDLELRRDRRWHLVYEDAISVVHVRVE